MAKKLSSMTWDDVRDAMSIAGNPEKITTMGQQIQQLIGKQMDSTNRAELTNIEFVLRRLTVEVKLWQKMYDRSH